MYSSQTVSATLGLDDSTTSTIMIYLKKDGGTNNFFYYIIIRKGRQCKAGRERLTPYESEDPNPTTPTHRMKEEKGKTVGDKK